MFALIRNTWKTVNTKKWNVRTMDAKNYSQRTNYSNMQMEIASISHHGVNIVDNMSLKKKCRFVCICILPKNMYFFIFLIFHSKPMICVLIVLLYFQAHFHTCAKLPLECALCGKTNILRDEMEDHLCPEAEKPCKFHYAGCLFKVCDGKCMNDAKEGGHLECEHSPWSPIETISIEH